MKLRGIKSVPSKEGPEMGEIVLVQVDEMVETAICYVTEVLHGAQVKGFLDLRRDGTPISRRRTLSLWLECSCPSICNQVFDYGLLNRQIRSTSVQDTRRNAVGLCSFRAKS